MKEKPKNKRGRPVTVDILKSALYLQSRAVGLGLMLFYAPCPWHGRWTLKKLGEREVYLNDISDIITYLDGYRDAIKDVLKEKSAS